MKPIITIRNTSMRGQCILVMERTSGENIPLVSLQMPTHIALWIKHMAEHTQVEPDQFLPQQPTQHKPTPTTDDKSNTADTDRQDCTAVYY